MKTTPNATPFEPISLTTVPDAVKAAPSAGPYNWAVDAWSTDSFVFRAGVVRGVSTAEFA